LPNLLPGGRPVADPSARADVAAAWGVEILPAQPGRDATGIVAAAAGGELSALVVGGVDLADTPEPEQLRAALESVAFWSAWRCGPAR
jgi:NADH-quinone oxidoreductase subunit G